MPDNSAAGDVWNPPDTESTMGISYDNCEAEEAVGPRAALPVSIDYPTGEGRAAPVCLSFTCLCGSCMC
jgi:hypothetical protein